MKKKDLKNGMIVETRRGELGLIVKDNCYGEDAIIYNENSWTGLDSYGENLIWYAHEKNRSEFTKSCDIVKVYKPDLPTGFLGRTNKFGKFTPIWERESTPEYTMEELIQKLGYEFKIKK